MQKSNLLAPMQMYRHSECPKSPTLTIEQRIDANGLLDAASPSQQDRKSQLACVVLAFDDVDTAVETIAGKIHPIVADIIFFGIHVALLIAAPRIPIPRSTNVSVRERLHFSAKIITAWSIAEQISTVAIRRLLGLLATLSSVNSYKGDTPMKTVLILASLLIVPVAYAANSKAADDGCNEFLRPILSRDNGPPARAER